MISEREIKSRYAKINKNFGSNGRNIYKCLDGHYTLATHKDIGVTPFIIQCACGEEATSFMYRVPQRGEIIDPETYEIVMPIYAKIWVRPSLEWLLEENKKEGYTCVEHVLSGGLISSDRIKKE